MMPPMLAPLPPLDSKTQIIMGDDHVDDHVERAPNETEASSEEGEVQRHHVSSSPALAITSSTEEFGGRVTATASSVGTTDTVLGPRGSFAIKEGRAIRRRKSKKMIGMNGGLEGCQADAPNYESVDCECSTSR